MVRHSRRLLPGLLAAWCLLAALPACSTGTGPADPGPADASGDGPGDTTADALPDADLPGDPDSPDLPPPWPPGVSPLPPEADPVLAGGLPAEYGAVIHRSATHLLGLIDDLIDQASQDGSVDEVRSEPVETQPLLAGLAFEAEGLVLAGGSEFVFHPAPGLPPRIRVDSRRLRQVLINLLDNAAKFTRAGRVEFRVDADSMSSTPRLIFTVRDSGPGMSASQLAVVFEPYRRADEAAGFPGLGLGLAIARHWTERMGGEIVADSAPGQGTTMRVLLPVELPEPCAVSPSAAPEGAAAPRAADELTVPAAELLAEASALQRLGAVSDLEDWAAGLLASQPQHAAFARRVAELAGRADLRALALLLQRPAPAGSAVEAAGPEASP